MLRIKNSLLTLFIAFFAFQFTTEAQTVNLLPSSFNSQACNDSIPMEIEIVPHNSDTILFGKLSLPITSQWYYLTSSATFCGQGAVDSILVNDSLHFFVSNLNNQDTLKFLIGSGCGSIMATNYNFDIDLEADFLMNNLSINSASSSSHVTVSSPFLVLDSRPTNAASPPAVGDTIIRNLIIKNTGSLSFNGAFRFTYNSQWYAEILGSSILNSSIVSNVVASTNDSTGIIEGDLSNFLTTDSIVFIDTMVLKSCDIDSTKTYYTFNYGCDSSDLCQNVGITPFIYSDIIDASPTITAFEYHLDEECFLNPDTMYLNFGLTNSGNRIAKDFQVSVTKQFDGWIYNQSPYISPGNFEIIYNGNSVSPDSIRHSTQNCSSDSVVAYFHKIISEFKPGDSIRVSYKTVTCCDNHNNSFIHYGVGAVSKRFCSNTNFVHFNYGTGRHATKAYNIDQFFENYPATIQIAPGDLDRTSDPVDFDIENTLAYFQDVTAPSDTLITTGSPFYQLLGTDSNAVIEVKLLLDTGLLYVDSTLYMQTLPNATFQMTLHPFEVTKKLGPNSTNGDGGMKDTIIARFSLKDTLYGKTNINHRWRYDSLEYFFSDSKVYFQLQGVCPAKQPKTKVEQIISLIPDTSCTESCIAILNEVEEEPSVMCPGCLTPGYIVTNFNLDRISVGEKDNDDNHFPDNPGANESADPSLINTKRALIGDTLALNMGANLWNGTVVTVANLGFSMKNTIVVFLLGNGLELVDSIQCVFYESSLNKYDTLMLPNSYLKTIYGSPGLDLHIDSLKAEGWANAQNLNYYDGNDKLFINAKVKVVANPGDPYESVTSFIRVYGSGVVSANAGCDAPDCWDDTLTIPEKEVLKYWCEFQGDITTLVRINAANPAVNNGIYFFRKGFAGVYGHVVSGSQYLYFMDRSNSAVTIGGAYDDSFPFEYRDFVEFDSVIIEKPANYNLNEYRASNRSSSHDGALNPYYSYMQPFTNFTYNSGTNSYVLFPEERFVDTSALPPFNDVINGVVRRNILRDSVIFNSDEETWPRSNYRISPEICATAIGKHHYFSFKGILKSYPLQDSAFTFYYDSLDAYLPAVKMTTEMVSADTAFLTDTVNTSYFRLKNDPSINPIIEGNNPNNNRYLMAAYENVFVRVIPSSNQVHDIKVKFGNNEVDYVDSLDYYKLFNAVRGAPARTYGLEYSYSCPFGTSNVIDSITVITGWNTYDFPDSIEHACQLDTIVYYIVPEEAGLDVEFVVEDSNIYCNPLPVQVVFNSQGSGQMINIESALNLNNSTLSYLSGSGQLEFPLGVFTPFEPDVNLVWHFDDINHFDQNGFVYSDGQAILHFELDGWPQSADEIIAIDAFGESYCGDTISFNFAKDFSKVGLQGAFALSDSILLCDTISYTLCLNSLDSGQIWNMTANLDLGNSGGYQYVPNSARIEFPQGTFTAKEPISSTWYFDSIPYLVQNGFTSADSTLKLHFDVAGTNPSSNDTLKLDVIGVTDCNDSISLNFDKPLPDFIAGNYLLDILGATMHLDSCKFNTSGGTHDTLSIKYKINSLASNADSLTFRLELPYTYLDANLSNVSSLGNNIYDYRLYAPFNLGQIDSVLIPLFGDTSGVCREIIKIKGIVHDNTYCYNTVNQTIQDSTEILHGSETNELNLISSEHCEVSIDSSRICARFNNTTNASITYVFHLFETHLVGNDSPIASITKDVDGINDPSTEVCFMTAMKNTNFTIIAEPAINPCDCYKTQYDVLFSGACDDFNYISGSWRSSLKSDRDHNHYSIENSEYNTVIAGTLFDSSQTDSASTHVVKLTPSGQILWEKEFNFGDLDERCFDVYVTEDQEILLTGYVRNSDDDDPSKTRMFAAKLDKNGTLLNFKKLIANNEKGMVGFDILKSPYSEFYHLAGYSSENTLDLSFSKTAVVLALNSDFDFRWYKEVFKEKESSDVATDLTDIDDKGIFVTGAVGSHDQNTSAIAMMYDYNGNRVWDLSRTNEEDNLIGVDAVYDRDKDELYLLLNNQDKSFEIDYIRGASGPGAVHTSVFTHNLFDELKETVGYAIEFNQDKDHFIIGGFLKYMKKDGVFTHNTPSFIAEVQRGDFRLNWLRYLEIGNTNYREQDIDVFQTFEGERAHYNYPDILCIPHNLNIQLIDYESNGETFEVGVTQFDEDGQPASNMQCQEEFNADEEEREPMTVELEEEEFEFEAVEVQPSFDTPVHEVHNLCPETDICDGFEMSLEYINSAGYHNVRTLWFEVPQGQVGYNVQSIFIDFGDGTDTTIGLNDTIKNKFFDPSLACNDILIEASILSANGKSCTYNLNLLKEDYAECNSDMSDLNGLTTYNILGDENTLIVAGRLDYKTEDKFIHIQKFDSLGNILWDKLLDYENYIHLTDLEYAKDGNVVITGSITKGEGRSYGDETAFITIINESTGEPMKNKLLDINTPYKKAKILDVTYSESKSKYLFYGVLNDFVNNKNIGVVGAMDTNLNVSWSKALTNHLMQFSWLSTNYGHDILEIDTLGFVIQGKRQNDNLIYFDYTGNIIWEGYEESIFHHASAGLYYDKPNDRLISASEFGNLKVIDNLNSASPQSTNHSLNVNAYYNGSHSSSAVQGNDLKFNERTNKLNLLGMVTNLRSHSIYPSFALLEIGLDSLNIDTVVAFDRYNNYYSNRDEFTSFADGFSFINYVDENNDPNRLKYSIVKVDSLGSSQVECNYGVNASKSVNNFSLQTSPTTTQSAVIGSQSSLVRAFNTIAPLTNDHCYNPDSCVISSLDIIPTHVNCYQYTFTSNFSIDTTKISHPDSVTYTYIWNIDGNEIVTSSYSLTTIFAGNLCSYEVCLEVSAVDNFGTQCSEIICEIIDVSNDLGGSCTSCTPVTQRKGLKHNAEDDFLEEEQFKVYPNPTNDQLTIDFIEKLDGQAQLKLLSIEGKVVLQESVGSVTKHTVNVSDLPKGIYYLLLDTAQKQLREKIIVQ